MPTIEEKKHYTVLVELEVNPDEQQTLINILADQVEKHIKPFPGFISASFHASEDGARVINYAQWRSRESYKSFLEADPAEPRKVFDRYVKSMRSDHPLKVEHVIEKE